MELAIAIDELYAAGWSTLDSAGCEFGPDGRLFPGLKRIVAEFEAAGFDFTLRRVEVFDCFRAQWGTPGGEAAGGVVGRTEAEAAVYALAQLRRSFAHA